MLRRTARQLALAAIGLLAPTAALAHPHILIDAHAIVEMKAGKVISVYMGWKFDQVYSSSLVQDFDRNKNATFDPEEIKALENEAFGDTAKQDYFTHIKVDGKPVDGLQARDFKVIVQKDAIVYGFRLPLPQPVDPRAQRLKIVVYEETYYIDIAFPNSKAVVIAGDGAQGCTARVAEDHSEQILGGIVIPTAAEVTCSVP